MVPGAWCRAWTVVNTQLRFLNFRRSVATGTSPYGALSLHVFQYLESYRNTHTATGQSAETGLSQRIRWRRRRCGHDPARATPYRFQRSRSGSRPAGAKPPGSCDASRDSGFASSAGDEKARGLRQAWRQSRAHAFSRPPRREGIEAHGGRREAGG